MSQPIWIYIALWFTSFFILLFHEKEINKASPGMFSQFGFAIVITILSFFLVGTILAITTTLKWIWIKIQWVVLVIYAKFLIWHFTRKYNLNKDGSPKAKKEEIL